MKVYKYPLEVTDYQTLDLPNKSQILTVQVQDGTPTIWVLVGTDMAFEQRHIRMAGTGHAIKEDIVSYIGTFQLKGYLGHLFEVKGKTTEHIK